MKHKKTVTEAVLAANRNNAQSATGPKTARGKAHSRKNAFRHGILARNVVLDTHKQRAEFRQLRRRSKKELHPKGLFEKFVVEEITTTLWKLGILEPLVVRELLQRQELSDDVTGIFGNFTNDLDLPISRDDLPLDRGWDCERMVVRAVAGKDQRHSNTTLSPGVFQGQVIPAVKSSQNSNRQEGDHLEIEAVMGSALENVTRYQTKLKRDFYRAMKELRKLQAERRKAKTDAHNTAARERAERRKTDAHNTAARERAESSPEDEN